MTCYITTVKQPTRAEFEIWKSLGYRGDYDQYSGVISKQVGAKMFFCGRLGPPCADCSDFGDFLCDYPVGRGKTCDRSMCESHAHEIAPEIHYCDAHHGMWTEFKDSGGVKKSLKNIVAFKAEK